MIIYNFIKYLILNIKYTRILNKVYKEENLLINLSNLFGIQFKKDWVGRIYTVINPFIIDGNDFIFEYNERGIDYKRYIEKYIMTKLNIVQEFIYTNNLFELITYKINPIDDKGNYLFVMQPITLDDFFESSKKFLKLLLTIFGIISIYITYKFLI